MENNTPFVFSQKFPKNERLTSKKIIEELFSKGSSAFLYPFRLLYLPRPGNEASSSPSNPQVLFSVSKRNFKKAVDRNLIKRRMRQAYRRNKQILTLSLPADKQAHVVAIIYVAKEKIPFEIIEKKLILAWQRLVSNQGPA